MDHPVSACTEVEEAGEGRGAGVKSQEKESKKSSKKSSNKSSKKAKKGKKVGELPPMTFGGLVAVMAAIHKTGVSKSAGVASWLASPGDGQLPADIGMVHECVSAAEDAREFDGGACELWNWSMLTLFAHIWAQPCIWEGDFMV